VDHAGGQVTPTTCATQSLACHLKLLCLCAQHNQMLWEPDSYAYVDSDLVGGSQPYQDSGRGASTTNRDTPSFETTNKAKHVPQNCNHALRAVRNLQILAEHCLSCTAATTHFLATVHSCPLTSTS
jgi:hypothetical protein